MRAYPTRASDPRTAGRSPGALLYRVATLWAFAGFPLVLFVALFAYAGLSRTGDYAFDFRQFWQGAHDVVHGHSPYPSRELLETSSDRLTPVGIQHVFRFPYPAACAVLLGPFGALPFHVAAPVEVSLLVAAVVASLWLVGVRDWRIVGLAFGTVVVNGAIRLGTLTPFLMLLIAVAWRWRDRRRVAAPALALAIVAKVFIWPLLVWLVVTRRYATAALSAGLTAVIVAGGWAVIGFDGLRLYPELVRRLAATVADRGYSVVALGTHLGLSYSTARFLPYLVGALVVVACLAVTRLRVGDRATTGDQASFALSVLASVVLSPIVWLHYFALLFVPLAVSRPRLSLAWGLPLLFWITPTQENEGELWRIVVPLVVGTAMVLAASTEARASPTVPSAGKA